MVHSVLKPQIDSTTARSLATRCCPTGFTLADASRSHFPLLGLSFQLQGFTGPARFLDGNDFGVAVDLVSGTPLLTPELLAAVSYETKLPEGAIAVSELQFRITRSNAIHAARHTLSTKLLSTLRLGSSFELQLQEEIWPLWKPNWIIRTTDNKLRFLVDGINGNVVSKSG